MLVDRHSPCSTLGYRPGPLARALWLCFSAETFGGFSTGRNWPTSAIVTVDVAAAEADARP